MDEGTGPTGPTGPLGAGPGMGGEDPGDPLAVPIAVKVLHLSGLSVELGCVDCLSANLGTPGTVYVFSRAKNRVV